LAEGVEEAREAGAQSAPVIRAAGGLVVRERQGDAEVLVVHRPRYDDWTFPKGKARPGETDEDCALREVEEETGLRCDLGRELGSSTYTDAQGRPKRVRYWLMRPVTAELRFEHEVDDAEWLLLDAAERRLSYDRDRLILDDLRVAA
jgi:8-oxo-dGTP pyrophosphatase MutT (NUDIX family)